MGAPGATPARHKRAAITGLISGMSAVTIKGGAPPRIERLRVRNFRALRDVELTPLTPLTGLLGPNGIEKSTVFDVFAFLAECFEGGLRRAWEKRGRARELKSRDGAGPVLIEIAYREQPRRPLITYHLDQSGSKRGHGTAEGDSRRPAAVRDEESTPDIPGVDIDGRGRGQAAGMARVDADRRGTRTRSGTWPVCRLSGRFGERQRVCRGGAFASRARVGTLSPFSRAISRRAALSFSVGFMKPRRSVASSTSKPAPSRAHTSMAGLMLFARLTVRPFLSVRRFAVASKREVADADRWCGPPPPLRQLRISPRGRGRGGCRHASPPPRSRPEVRPRCPPVAARRDGRPAPCR